jgi:glycosyltransferase involved in cell wall biosynthesis
VKVVHVIDDARPVGGAQTYVRRFCAGTIARDWEHAVVADTLPGTPIRGVSDIRAASGDPKADTRLVLDLAPDVVFLHTVNSAELAQALGERVRTVVYEHDYRHISPGNLRFFLRSESFCERGFGAHCLLKPYTERCNNRRPDRVLGSIRRVRQWRPVLGSLDAVLCASEFVAGLVEGFAPAAKATVVGYPIDVPAAPVPPASSRRDVLYVGRTSPVKGIHHLVDAFALLARDHPEAKLLIAGGPDLDQVQEHAASRGVADAVELLGWLEGARLVAAYERARVLAVPSVWPEPFGMAGPEALAYGIPVVASDVGGIGSWLDSTRGTLVPAGDPAALAAALGRYLEDAALADTAGAAGRDFVGAELTLSRHLDRVVPIFEGSR